MTKTLDDVKFRWGMNAEAVIGAPFSMYRTGRHKVEVFPVSSRGGEFGCERCIEHDDERLSCTELPTCDYLTFTPNTTEAKTEYVLECMGLSTD